MKMLVIQLLEIGELLLSLFVSLVLILVLRFLFFFFFFLFFFFLFFIFVFLKRREKGGGRIFHFHFYFLLRSSLLIRKKKKTTKNFLFLIFFFSLSSLFSPQKVSYIILIGDFLHPIMEDIGDNDDAFWKKRIFLQLIVTCGIIIPLCLMPSVTDLRFISLASLIVAYLFIGTVIYRFAADYDDRDSQSLGTIEYATFSVDLLRTLGVPVFAYSAHTILVPVTSEMKDNRFSNVVTSINLANGCCIVSFVICGVFGYLAFLDTTEGNILNNYGDNGLLINIVRGMMTLVICFTYPLCIIPLRVSLDNLLFSTFTCSNPDGLLFCFVFFFCFFFSIFFLKIQNLLIPPPPPPVSFFFFLFLFLTIFFFLKKGSVWKTRSGPITAIHSATEEELLMGTEEEPSKVFFTVKLPSLSPDPEDDGYDPEKCGCCYLHSYNVTAGVVRFVIETVVVVLLTFILAAAIPNVERVFAFVGGTFSACTSFIFPGFFYYSLRHRDHKGKAIKNVGGLFLVGLGLFMLVLTVVVNILDFV